MLAFRVLAPPPTLNDSRGRTLRRAPAQARYGSSATKVQPVQAFQRANPEQIAGDASGGEERAAPRRV